MPACMYVCMHACMCVHLCVSPPPPPSSVEDRRTSEKNDILLKAGCAGEIGSLSYNNREANPHQLETSGSHCAHPPAHPSLMQGL